jgi:hypothetical protein
MWGEWIFRDTLCGGDFLAEINRKNHCQDISDTAQCLNSSDKFGKERCVPAVIPPSDATCFPSESASAGASIIDYEGAYALLSN